jgi:hypothetical protein
MNEPAFIFDYFRYPVITVKFYYNGKETPYIDALLDSGGDFIVIPMPVAKYLGLKLQKAGNVDTAGGTTSLYKATLTMVIKSKEREVTYKNIEIHVSGRNDIPILLGRQPIFEDYEIIFNKKENKLILKSISP